MTPCGLADWALGAMFAMFVVGHQWRYWRLRPYRRDKTRGLANGIGIDLSADRIEPEGEGARLRLIRWIWIGIPILILSLLIRGGVCAP